MSSLVVMAVVEVGCGGGEFVMVVAGCRCLGDGGGSGCRHRVWRLVWLAGALVVSAGCGGGGGGGGVIEADVLTPSFVACGRGVTSQCLCSEVVNAYLLGNVGSLAEIII